MNKRLFLIDGHSLIFRMYYAFMRRPMVNSKGEDTSILYGFTKYLLELVRRWQPDALAVMFDPPAKTFRHELSPDYKANRAAAPELVKAALDPLVEIMLALRVPVVMQPGFEADDMIGTVATRAAAEGFDVYMVTPDKDLGQIIAEHIFQLKPARGAGEDEVLTREKLLAETGLTDPRQIIDILTLWGDASDNIKGVEGVGEVGARKLVGRYGTVENIYAHLDELSPRQQESFRKAEPYIALSKTLATIKTDVDYPFDADALSVRMCLDGNVAALFDRYEFPSLKSLLPQASGEDKPLAVAEKVLEPSRVEWEQMASDARRDGLCAIAHSEQGWIVSDGKRFALSDDAQADALLQDATIAKIGFDIKSAIHVRLKEGRRIAGDLYDVELMHYLVNPERSHNIETLLKGYLGLALDAPAAEPKAPATLFDVVEDTSAEDGLLRPSRICAACALLFGPIRKELEDAGQWKLYTDIEMPLIEVLADMEETGVKVDPQRLREYAAVLSADLARIEAEARALAGEPQLNIASPRQVGQVIYEKLNLAPGRKKSKKDSYPTDEETLSMLPVSHPFVGKVLEYRAVRKMLSTYLEPLAALIDPRDGRLHTTFNQALTATGRLSSVRPNLQNIPIRTERGREIRKAFVPGTPGGSIVSADYSQIELRLMAVLSGEKALIEGFRAGADIHADTASRIFHTPLTEVTRDQRSQAKVANFGIIYGISPFGLAQRMGIPRSEARSFIESYFRHYPMVQEYMQKAADDARSKGYVETIYGRKRFLPDIASRNPVVRQLAERNAINAPIQGSAADIIKLAMIRVWHRLNDAGLRSKMVLQVHDELVIDVVPGELEAVMDIVKTEMEGVCSLAVPLAVECNHGENWLEAH